MLLASVFEPKPMAVGILTAAYQELTPRAVRDADPDRAIEDWLAYASELHADCIQLSAAVHPSLSDIAPEAMLDPVANTLDLRAPFTKDRAARVRTAIATSNVAISDIGYFDNMLCTDHAARATKHAFMTAVFDVAVDLEVPAVCGFVGRDAELSLDQNMLAFEEAFIPLLRAAHERGLQYRVEQCPMPGWTTADTAINNIAYTPALWIRLHGICERHGLGDAFRIHYDPSHAILLGQDTRSIFSYLRDEGYAFLIAGFHVKGQVIDPRGIAAWGYAGQTVDRGDWVDGTASSVPSDQAMAWKKQTAICEHELPGTARHDPLAYLQNRSVDWLDHQLALRELLDLDLSKVPLIVEHEYPPGRLQARDAVTPLLAGSLAFMRHIDRAAAAMHALQSSVLPHLGLSPQGIGRIAYRS